MRTGSARTTFHEWGGETNLPIATRWAVKAILAIRTLEVSPRRAIASILHIYHVHCVTAIATDATFQDLEWCKEVRCSAVTARAAD